MDTRRQFRRPVPKRYVLALCCTPFWACGATAPEGETAAQGRVVTEGRAMEILEELSNSLGVTLGTGWRVDVGAAEEMDVDRRLGATDYGIEWVSPQDRARFGEHIPTPEPSDPSLHVTGGSGPDAAIQILVLEQSQYGYESSATHVQRGATGVREVEARLRQDFTDFINYVRGQGAAL